MNQKRINIPDEELIKGCISGDEKYFSMLFHKYYGKMFHVCRRYVSKIDEAEDLAQEGFINVFNNIAKYEFKGSFEGWIRRIMMNNAINYLNSKKKISHVENIEDDAVQFEIETLSVSNDEVTNHISNEALMKLVDNLPPIYKVVFNLYVMDDHSHKEIGEMLNITESTSRSNLTKARLKLKNAVEELLIKERMNYA